MYNNHQNGLIDLRYSCYTCTAIHFYISNFIFFQHFTMSGKRYSSQAEWAKSQFKFEPHEGKGGKWCCIHEVDDPTTPNKKRRCSQTYGQATNKCSWVQHLRREHGLELPLNLQQKQEILQNDKQLTVALTNTIRNHKEFSKSLHDMQKANNVVRPLILFHTANTRKWSSGFLLTCRAIQLRQYIDIVMANPNYPSEQEAITWGQVELTRGVTFNCIFWNR